MLEVIKHNVYQKSIYFDYIYTMSVTATSSLSGMSSIH